MENLLVQFRENVLSGKREFEMENQGKKLFFVLKQSGKATLIYGCYNYEEQLRLDNKFELVGIRSDGGIVHIVDTHMFYPHMKGELPSGVVNFRDTVCEYDNEVCIERFPKFYENLPTIELSEKEVEHMSNQAREYILYNKTVEIPTIFDVLNNEKVFDFLCGYQTLGEFTEVYFEHIKENYVKRKSLLNELSKQIEAMNSVEAWEVELCHSVLNTVANQVNVEFTVNGKSMVAKLAPQTITRKLYQKDYFDNYCFATRKVGEEVMKNLGVRSYRLHNEEDNVLTCEHITSITYGRKTIYTKNK